MVVAIVQDKTSGYLGHMSSTTKFFLTPGPSLYESGMMSVGVRSLAR